MQMTLPLERLRELIELATTVADSEGKGVHTGVAVTYYVGGSIEAFWSSNAVTFVISREEKEDEIQTQH